MNARQLTLIKEVVDILRPIFKTLPKDEATNKQEIDWGLLLMLDSIYDKMAKGKFDKERKGFSDALFNLIDVDKDGKISPDGERRRA